MYVWPCHPCLSIPSNAPLPSSDCDLSVREIIARIQRHQDQFLSKFTKKKQVENAYYENRYAGYSPTKAPQQQQRQQGGAAVTVVAAASPSNGALSR